MKILFNQISSFLSLSFITILLMASCTNNSSNGGKSTSNFSGWETNDKEGWLFTGDTSSAKPHNGMMFIKGGTFIMGKVTEDVLMDFTNTPERKTVPSFLLGENEITNYDYLQYISWLEYVFPKENSGTKSIIDGASPNKSVWKNSSNVNDVIGKEYFVHPSYSYYPVVGVTWIQAQRYCDWLTDRVNEKNLIDKGIVNKNLYTDPNLLSVNNIFSSSAFENNPKELSKDSLSIIDSTNMYSALNTKSVNNRAIFKTYGSNVVTRFRLPTEAEWEYAAIGISKAKSKNEKSNIYKGNKVFNKQMTGRKSSDNSNFAANFKESTNKSIHNIDRITFTNQVKSLPANDLGLYGMYGNVSEWVQDSYKTLNKNSNSEIKEIYNESESVSSTNLKKVNFNDIKFDTMSDGRVLYRSLPGDYQKEENTVIDSAAVDLKKSKKPSELTTYVKSDSKVVKGASWKDNSYWIDPGQRRFLSQDRANNWVGFRVAQDNSSETSKNK